MIFWAITGTMAAVVALIVGRALIRGGGDILPSQDAYDLKVYRDQLAEVERDVLRGVVPAEDAARVRTEISRRILAADSAAQHATPKHGNGPARSVAVVLVAALLAGSLGLYWWLGQPGYGDLALQDRIARAETVRKARPDQATAEKAMPPAPLREGLSDDYLILVEKLRETVAERPDDLQGHQLLAQNEADIGNFAAAARAQEQVLRIKGADATLDDLGYYAELLVQAAGGYVSPQAETVLRTVLDQDREDGRARYFYGLMMLQTGRPDIAFRLWDGLLRRGPPDAPWIAPIQAQILPLSELAGVNYSMPDIGSGQPGPTAADVDAAAQMNAEDRMEMIGGMVANLSDRLASEGGPPADWARLITSLGVLGESEQALAVFNNALEVFAGDPGALDIIRDAGSRAGVAE